ncbi:unnamed protein product, partial [Polarella glacialis]
ALGRHSDMRLGHGDWCAEDERENQALNSMEHMVSALNDEDNLEDAYDQVFERQQSGAGPRPRRPKLRTNVQSLENRVLDVEPMRKGMYGWLHPSGKGYAQYKILDVRMSAHVLCDVPCNRHGESPAGGSRSHGGL